MKKFVESLTMEKWPRMKGKMMTLTFSELYIVYIKNGTILFLYFLTYLNKDTSPLVKVINISTS